MLLVLCVAGLFMLPAQAGWREDRAQARRARAALREAAQADRDTRGRHAYKTIEALVSQVESGQVVVARDDLWQLIAGLARLAPEKLGDLPRRIRALDLTDTATDNAGSQALAQARTAVTDRPWELLRKSVEAGNVPLAADFLWEILYFDPDYEPIRKALGQQKVAPEKIQGLPTRKITGKILKDLPEIEPLHPDRYWFGAFDAARIRQGYWWDPRLGWIDARHPQRYEKGFYYDLQRKRWTTLDEANAYHAKPGRDWQVRTAHLLVRGTASLQTLVRVANQLEALYAAIFANFSNFFSNSRSVDVMRYALGLAEHEPFEVWVYATRDEYLHRADAVCWSAGIFNPSTGKAYFYGSSGDTMYHEFTHQVLHVLTGDNRAPSWLTEGAAVYTQTVRFGLQGASFPGAARDRSWQIDDLFKLRDGNDWYRAVETAQRKRQPSPYPAAGSVVTFAMQYADGDLRHDFIDFLRDSYHGRAGTSQLWDYLGMSESQFKAAYQAWRTQRPGDRPERQSHPSMQPPARTKTRASRS